MMRNHSRWTSWTCLATVVALTLVVGACNEAPSPTAPQSPQQSSTAATGSSGVAAAAPGSSNAQGGNSAGPLVTGSAHVFLPDPLRDGQLGLRDFTVNVVQRGNGSIGGTMHLGSVSSLRPGLSFIGEVTCATVIDNGDGTKDAWVGGTNRHTNFDGNDLGDQFAVRVRDVGEPQAGADGVSGVRFAGLVNFPGIGDWACANTPGWTVFPADNGNLTIR